MKILVATKETQRGTDDFYWCDGEEIVYFPYECCSSLTCGCGRAFAGIKSKKSTTTAKVVEKKMSQGELIAILEKAHEESGYGEGREWARDMVRDILEVTKAFDVGSIIARRHGTFDLRRGGQRAV